MKAVNYIKSRGIRAILEDCNFNFRSVKAHLKRHCKITNFSTILPAFKKFLKENEHFSNKIEKLLEKIIKENFRGVRHEE